MKELALPVSDHVPVVAKPMSTPNFAVSNYSTQQDYTTADISDVEMN